MILGRNLQCPAARPPGRWWEVERVVCGRRRGGQSHPRNVPPSIMSCPVCSMHCHRVRPCRRRPAATLVVMAPSVERQPVAQPGSRGRWQCAGARGAVWCAVYRGRGRMAERGGGARQTTRRPVAFCGRCTSSAQRRTWKGEERLENRPTMRHAIRAPPRGRRVAREWLPPAALVHAPPRAVAASNSGRWKN